MPYAKKFVKKTRKAPLTGKPLYKKAVNKAVSNLKKKSLKSMIRQVLKPEVKCVSNLNLANKVLVYGSGLNYAQLSPNQGWVSLSGVIPPLSLGNTVDTRVGNFVTPVRLNIRYSIYANPSTQSDSTGGNINPYYGLPFRVKVIVFRHRWATDEASQTGIIQAGATSADLSSDIDTFFRPYNRDEYIIKYSRMFKLQNPRHQMTGTTMTGQSQDPYAKSMVIRNINMKLPKLRYNDATTTSANQQYYIAFAVCNEDSSVITAGSQSRCTINVESHLYFTDD